MFLLIFMNVWRCVKARAPTVADYSALLLTTQHPAQFWFLVAFHIVMTMGVVYMCFILDARGTPVSLPQQHDQPPRAPSSLQYEPMTASQKQEPCCGTTGCGPTQVQPCSMN